MADFLVTVTAFKETWTGPIEYQSLREQLATVGLCDYLVNDSNEWIALPDNMFAAWVEGIDPDEIIAIWHEKLGTLFGGKKARGGFFVTVGSGAVWQAQIFD